MLMYFIEVNGSSFLLVKRSGNSIFSTFLWSQIMCHIACFCDSNISKLLESSLLIEVLHNMTAVCISQVA